MDGYVTVAIPTAGPPAPAMPMSPLRRRRRWLAALGTLLLLGLVVPVGLRVWVHSDGGRATIAGLVEDLLSNEIRGSMTIGSLDDISSEGVVGTDIRFEDESGRLVLLARHAELDVDWSELLSGHFVSHHGRARGGRVVLETLPSGTLLIDRAFDSAHPGPAGQPLGPDIVRLEGLVASDIEVIVSLHGAPDIRAEHVSAILLVRAPEHGGGHVRADRIDGSLRIEAPIPIDLTLEDGTLSLDGDSRRRAVIELPAHVNGEAIQFDVRVRADASENMHVAVHLVPSGIGAAIVSLPLITQALVAGSLCDVLDVTVDLP